MGDGELVSVVDEVWVSLNAPDETTYIELCDPGHDLPDSSHQLPVPQDYWMATLDFIQQAASSFKRVGASVVGHTITAAEIESSRRLAESLGCTDFRVR
jgi:hypothetical protein